MSVFGFRGTTGNFSREQNLLLPIITHYLAAGIVLHYVDMGHVLNNVWIPFTFGEFLLLPEFLSYKQV